jgi:DnaK suppressor protein
VTFPNGMSMDLDSVGFVPIWDSAWKGATGGSTVLGFSVASGEAVDDLYATLTQDGYAGRQAPYDAFFGARYAMVEDPDGNPVGLMSPIDPGRRRRRRPEGDRSDLTGGLRGATLPDMDNEKARALVEAEKARVQQLLGSTENAAESDRETANEAGPYDEPAERLTAEEGDDAVAEGLRDRLAALQRAEQRLEAGTYGISVRSGAKVPDERLEADPAAELTAEEAEQGVPDGRFS